MHKQRKLNEFLLNVTKYDIFIFYSKHFYCHSFIFSLLCERSIIGRFSSFHFLFAFLFRSIFQDIVSMDTVIMKIMVFLHFFLSQSYISMFSSLCHVSSAACCMKYSPFCSVPQCLTKLKQEQYILCIVCW